MKVLKEGNWNATWELKVACPVCQAELLAEEADLKSFWSYNKKATEYFVVCPLCKKQVTISVEKLSKRLEEKLLQYKPSCSSDW